MPCIEFLLETGIGCGLLRDWRRGFCRLDGLAVSASRPLIVMSPLIFTTLTFPTSLFVFTTQRNNFSPPLLRFVKSKIQLSLVFTQATIQPRVRLWQNQLFCRTQRKKLHAVFATVCRSFHTLCRKEKFYGA